MRFLCIDYGKKRVGIAMSDEKSIIAFPYKILKNDEKLLDTIHNICGEENVSEIVIGESLDFKGNENLIMKDIKIFKKQLEKLTLPIHFEKEFMTSTEARGREGKEKNNAKKIKKFKNSKVDDSAAALILQRFLDRR